MNNQVRRFDRGERNRGFFPSLFGRNWSDDFFSNFMDNENVPATNVTETDKEYKLEVSAPGYQKEDFSLEIDNNILKISARKERTFGDDNQNKLSGEKSRAGLQSEQNEQTDYTQQTQGHADQPQQTQSTDQNQQTQSTQQSQTDNSVQQSQQNQGWSKNRCGAGTNGKVLRREFSYSSFSRSFTLPENVDTENISAKQKDGILEIILPKMEQAPEDRVKKIDIE